MKLSFTRTYATTVTNRQGQFHPAVLTEEGIFYWPNVTGTEDYAHKWAMSTLDNALAEAQRYADEWNVVRLPTGHTL